MTMVAAIKDLDVICIGSCVIDILCSPVNLNRPLSDQVLNHVEPIEIAGGGLTLNSGTTASRLGLKTAILTRVAPDRWLPVIRDLCFQENIISDYLIETPNTVNSVTVVTINPEGERCFIHCQGAPKQLSGKDLLDRLDVLARTKYCLMGYYSLMPRIEPVLAELYQKLNAVGTKTVLDASSQGGDLAGLVPAFPYLDIYVPSLFEASGQTGLKEPRDILSCYRDHGAEHLVGVKLGEAGSLLSPASGEYVKIPAVKPDRPIIDTTGAGDSYMAGLIAGLVKGMDIEQAGLLASAAASCTITSRGGSTGGRSFEQTLALLD